MDKTLHSAEQRRLVAILRRMRLEKKLTQAQVAARLQRPQSFVSKYESGERRLDIIELRAVAAALESDLRKVLKELDTDAPR